METPKYASSVRYVDISDIIDNRVNTKQVEKCYNCHRIMVGGRKRQTTEGQQVTLCSICVVSFDVSNRRKSLLSTESIPSFT